MSVNRINRFGCALFGVGRIGSVHFKNLIHNPRVDLRWIVDDYVDRGKELVELASVENGVRVVPSDWIDKVLQDNGVDAVIICTPSATHEEIIVKALKTGKAVFCEKPLAFSIETTKHCYELAEECGKPLFCAFNRHWDPQNRKIHKIIKNKDIGQLRVVKTVSRDPPGMATEEYIKTSGGIFIDSVVHDLNLICWLVGEFPCSVFASGHASNPMYAKCDDVDSCSVTLKFPCGVLGVIEVSREAPVGYFQYVEAMGSEGLVHTDHKRETRLKHWTLSGTKEEPLVRFLNRYEESYAAEMEHFLDVLQGSAVLEVTKEDVLNVNKLALLCKESVQKNEVMKDFTL